MLSLMKFLPQVVMKKEKEKKSQCTEMRTIHLIVLERNLVIVRKSSEFLLRKIKM